MAIERYNVIIVGSGAGGGTLLHTLAASGKRVLMLERGDFLPRELENWDPKAVFVENRYVAEETWFDSDGKAFQPQIHYFVGGTTKVYGAALYRLRPADFGEVKHIDGISPAWPLTYDEFEPYYTKAEWLYQVHGNRGEDPTEGVASRPYPWPAVSHEPRMAQLMADLESGGYHPFHAPCGIMLNEADRAQSACIRCKWCDGYPCLVHDCGRCRKQRKALAAFGERSPSAWTRQRVRPSRSQLCLSQLVGRHGDLHREKSDRLSKNYCPQRFLLWRIGFYVPNGQHPDGWQIAAANVPR